MSNNRKTKEEDRDMRRSLGETTWGPLKVVVFRFGRLVPIKTIQWPQKFRFRNWSRIVNLPVVRTLVINSNINRRGE